MTGPRIVVIGSGIAGLACAHALRAGGFPPLVLEKSRGLGGRLATRRTRAGLDFDHGAPCVAAADRAFTAFLNEAQRRGEAAAWRGEFVGTPGMSALPRLLAEGVEIRFEARVAEVLPRADHVRLRMEEGGALDADFVVCTAPAPQTRLLCAGTPAIAAAADAARMTPAWSLLAAFDRAIDAPDLTPGAAGAAGAHRMSSKPGRAASPERWVMEMSPEWTQPRLEYEREAVLPTLLEAFARLTGDDAAPIYAAAHRWRFSRTVRPVERPTVVEDRVAAAGDWLLGPDAGHAYASGLAAAGAAIDRLG